MATSIKTKYCSVCGCVGEHPHFSTVNASCKKLTFLRKINSEFQLANTTGDNRPVHNFEAMYQYNVTVYTESQNCKQHSNKQTPQYTLCLNNNGSDIC